MSEIMKASALIVGGFVVAGSSMAAALAEKTVTFTKDVAPILQAKCQDCHRKGSMAPMSLVTYQETRPWAKAIRERVLTRQMPPWHSDKTVGIQHFANDISLSDDQIATLVHWVDTGAPMGDPKDMPPAKQWPDYDGWKLASQFGQPDLVLKSDDYTMPAHGQDVWFKPLTSIPITEARWVRAVEIRPGTPAGRKIMHHVLARLQQDEPGAQGADDREKLRCLPEQFRETAAAGRAHLVGTPPACCGRTDSRSRRTGRLPVSERPRAPASHAPDDVQRDRDQRRRSVARHPAEFARGDRRIPHVEAGCSIGKLPTAYALARQGDVDGSHLAGRPARDAELRGPFQLQLDDQLYLCRRCRSGSAQRHGDSRHGLARQYGGEPEQSGSEPMGRLGRSNGR